ncbi:unnamed protein product [Rotaria socialis]
MDSGGFWWILVDSGGFWWILVDSMDSGGFWWILRLLLDSGGFYGSWWNLRLLLDSRIHQEPLFPPWIAECQDQPELDFGWSHLTDQDMSIVACYCLYNNKVR